MGWFKSCLVYVMNFNIGTMCAFSRETHAAFVGFPFLQRLFTHSAGNSVERKDSSFNEFHVIVMLYLPTLASHANHPTTPQSTSLTPGFLGRFPGLLTCKYFICGF